MFILVFLSTFPVAIPFIFMAELGRALRVSNAIAIVMLFVLGYAFGTHDRAPPVAVSALRWWRLGAVLVGMTMALGG